jgi:hypothetical protein
VRRQRLNISALEIHLSKQRWDSPGRRSETNSENQGGEKILNRNAEERVAAYSSSGVAQ